jgi:hypothetical protein
MPASDAQVRSAPWVKPFVLCRPVGIVMLLVAALVVTGRASAMTASVARPRSITLAYGRFRLQGAPHSDLALRFRLEEHQCDLQELEGLRAPSRPQLALGPS